VIEVTYLFYRWLGQDESGMVLMEVSFPSGYEPVSTRDLKRWQSGDYVEPDRIEMDRGNLVLYYNQVCACNSPFQLPLWLAFPVRVYVVTFH